MLRDDIASDPAGRGEDMDREGGAQQNERPSETPRLKSADALARAMRALPRAELEIPRDQLFEDNPRYRALASATGQILWLATADGVGLAGMRDWRAFTGQSVEETARVGWLDAIHPDDRPRLLAHWGRAVESGRAFEAEHRIRRHDGVYREFTVRVTPVMDEAGAPREWAGACTDVTDQKRVAAALRAVQQVTDTALGRLTLDELLPALLDRVLAALDVDNATILLLDSVRRLTVRATRGFQEHVDTMVVVPLGRGVAGKIAADGAPLVVPDLSQVEVTHPLFQQFLTSLAGVPLLAPDGVRGVLHVATAAPRDFTDDDLRLLELVAQRIVVAMERAQIYEAERAAHRRASERALRFEAIIESMADAVIVCDHEGTVISHNQAALRLGLPDGAEDDVTDVIYRVMRRVLAGATLTGPDAVDITLAQPDHRAVELSLSGSPVWDRAPGGARALAGGVFVFHDVTERRVSERKTVAALNAMLTMAERLVAKDDPDGGSLTNQTGQRLVEGAATALGSQRVALVKWDEETDLLSSVASTGFTASASDPTWHFPDGQVRLSAFLTPSEIEQVRADQFITLDARILPRQVEQGSGALLLVPARIRERLMGLMVMESLQGQAEEVITLAQAIARLAALLLERDRLDREREEARSSALALEEANKRLDAFLGMTSHELRTPLTNIRGFTQLARKRLRPDAKQVALLATRLNADSLALLDAALEHAREPLALADTASDLLNRLVGDMLDVDAIRTGQLKIMPEPNDLAAITRETAHGLRMRHPEREIALDFSDDLSVPVVADAQRITQALTNYLTNALKYAPPDQPIVVILTAPVADGARRQSGARMAQVTVRDAGPGLPASEQERVWGRFARAEATERRTGGLGLGLFITRSIIALHGGRTWVESEPGAGCAFSFTLPLAVQSRKRRRG